MLRNTGNSERKQRGQFDVCFIQPTNNRTNNGFSRSGHYTPEQNKKCHFWAKILQIGMIPHNMPLFKFICALYQFHHQTPPIMKIERGQIQFRDYVFTGTEPDCPKIQALL